MLHCGCCSGLATVQISSSRMQACAAAWIGEVAPPAAVETARGLGTVNVTRQTKALRALSLQPEPYKQRL